MSDSEIHLLPRLGWMLYDDINRRLNILTEECLHLQQVIHYHGEFDISEQDLQSEECAEQAKMGHFRRKETHKRGSPMVRSMLSLYDHLGGLAIGLTKHQEEVRERFEDFLKQEMRQDGKKNGTWFWFVTMRGYLLHDVIEIYMEHLEQAHEKLIQILETKPGALPQPILLRRWNSALHGRFLSEYSRHVEWETTELFNQLKHTPSSNEEWQENRLDTSFIHSWAHNPTSMVNAFKVRDKTGDPNGASEKTYKLGRISSAFFYLEMPQLYPLLYHECAHLQFHWYGETRHDKGDFFTSLKNAANSLEESARPYFSNEIGFWRNFCDEIWADMIAINLGGLPYFVALTVQIFGQSSGKFFQNSIDVPLQDWVKKPVYDLEKPNDDSYFTEVRLVLAMHWLKKIHPEVNDIEENKLWLDAIELGLSTYHSDGEKIFNKQEVSAQHEHWWSYRKELNTWIFNILTKYQDLNVKKLNQDRYRILSEKYWISQDLINSVIEPVVCKFEKTFFDSDSYKDIKNYNRGALRIEYLPFNIKWYLSGRVINEIFTKKQKIKSFTFAYANHIRNDGAASFRIALEWIIARIDLSIAFADYFQDPLAITLSIKKLIDPADIKLHFLRLSETDKENVIKELRSHVFYDKIDNRSLSTLSKQIKVLIDSFMEKKVVKQLAAIHAGDEGVGIGTFTLGALGKYRTNNKTNKSIYYELANEVSVYYKDVLDCIDKLKHHSDTTACMPINYKTSSPYSYQSTQTNENSPTKTGLYFISGDYDFMHYQADITPGESMCHPESALHMLTKSRTVLDLHKEKGDKPRKLWGRVSLIKFRYRWEMYKLNEELETKPYRARLWLSSAWEDGILMTWHENAAAFKDEVFDGTSMEDSGTMDAQTCILLFKLDEGGKIITSDGMKEVECKNKMDIKESKFFSLMTQLTKKGIFESMTATTGRFDYVVQWTAKDSKKLTEDMLKLPDEFWQNVAHINTTWRRSLEKEKEDCYFISEIAANVFQKATSDPWWDSKEYLEELDKKLPSP